MSHCIDEVDRIYKSCGKTYELGDDGNYQVLFELQILLQVFFL